MKYESFSDSIWQKLSSNLVSANTIDSRFEDVIDEVVLYHTVNVRGQVGHEYNV